VTGLAGQQGLYGKIDRFQQLSTRANREMVELEPIHTDIENDRLEAAGKAENDETAPANVTEPAAPPTKLKPIS
jgi:DNA recombination protein RmuC